MMDVEHRCEPVGWWFLLWVGIGGLLPLAMTDETADNKTYPVCQPGPFKFTFEGGNVWDTRDSLWTVDNSPFERNHYMALRLSDDADQSGMMKVGNGTAGGTPPRHPGRGSQIYSPYLCSPHHGTYQLSFQYSVPGVATSSCYLAVSLWSNPSSPYPTPSSSVIPLFRSSGGTFNVFETLSPVLKFSVCSPEFKLIFQAAKVGTGTCGVLFDTVAFDNVEFSFVPNLSHKPAMCPDGPPVPWTDDEVRGLSITAVIAIIASLGVLVLALATLALTAICNARKRKKQETPFKTYYRTFANEAQVHTNNRLSGNSDYESYNAENDDTRDKAALISSGSRGSDVYDRLHDENEASPAAIMAGDRPQSHYDHLDGDDTSYNDLHQVERSRQMQRMTRAPEYSHV